MKTFRVTETAVINASAKVVYDIIADYHNGHPNIVPQKYFSDIAVEKGGWGAGTTIRFKMHVFGKTQDFRAAITEPEPGRVLVEANDEASGGAVTTFTVDPINEGKQARVTISTDLKPTTRLVRLERVFTSWVLRRVYAEELKLLARLAMGENWLKGKGERGREEGVAAQQRS
jgi:Polyketide cyclase / dehydrase and lipid transport